jgi:hypothetical protein
MFAQDNRGDQGKVMSRKFTIAAACATIASVATATAAFAVTPKAGQYAQIKGNRAYMEFTVQKGHVNNAVHYDSCVTVPLKMPSIKISSGRFSYTGKVSDYTNRSYQVHVDGHWVSATKAKGTWSAKRLSSPTCTSSYAYTVTRHS